MEYREEERVLKGSSVDTLKILGIEKSKESANMDGITKSKAITNGSTYSRQTAVGEGEDETFQKRNL